MELKQIESVDCFGSFFIADWEEVPLAVPLSIGINPDV